MDAKEDGEKQGRNAKAILVSMMNGEFHESYSAIFINVWKKLSVTSAYFQNNETLDK